MKNKIIISTRPVSQVDKLQSNLQELGVVYYSFPMIEIEKRELNEVDIELIKNSSEYDWIVFTSKNGVDYFFEAVKSFAPKLMFKKVKFAVIGKATSRILQNYGYSTSYINTGNTSKRLAADLRNLVKKNEKILFPLGDLASDDLIDAANIFATANRIDVYKTVLPSEIDQNIRNMIIENKYDLILVTSPSGINNLIEIIPEIEPAELKIACIGETTKSAAEEKNVKAKITASKSDADGLTISISEYFKSLEL